MWFIQLIDGVPVGHAVTYENFQQVNPGVFLNMPIRPSDIEPYGFGLFEWTASPDVGTFEVAEEVTPVRGEDGIWYQTWNIREMTASEHSAKMDFGWEMLRRDRNIRLAMCDWTQLADAPVDSLVWAVYRQELRDLPANTIDPFNPVWPQEPA